MDNTSFNNILLDNITTPSDIILTSSSPKVIHSNENVSGKSASSKSDKSYIAKIEDYISKKYDEVALQQLKRELWKKINNEVSCKSVVNSNESLVMSLPNSSKHEDQLPDQKAIAKHEANRAELESKVTEINNLTAEQTKVAAIPTNVSNLNSKSNSSPMIENIQHTHEIVSSISSKTAENEDEEVGSKTAKEQKENSQVENDHQVPQNKVAFIVGDSMLKDVDGYLLTGSLDKKFIVKVRPFSSVKTEDMHEYLKSTKRDFGPNIFILHVGTNNLSTSYSPEMIADKIVQTAESIKKGIITLYFQRLYLEVTN